jgi:hypothetical protein
MGGSFGSKTKKMEKERKNAMEMGQEKEKETQETNQKKSRRAIIRSPMALSFQSISNSS